MPGKVLIVDTVATNRIALKTKLMSASYEVWQASTVAQAVDISRRSGPDLVITAHHLDGQDATALCTMLAGSPRTGLAERGQGARRSRMSQETWILEGARTPMCRYVGHFAGVDVVLFAALLLSGAHLVSLSRRGP